jgi:hypothetical protein
MSLTGNLEDLPLLDILQIVSFSKKTGYLTIRAEEGEGGIVFLDGLVVAAFTWDSLPVEPRVATLSEGARGKAIRSRIEIALEQLIRLREGQFGPALWPRIALGIIAVICCYQVIRRVFSRPVAIKTPTADLTPSFADANEQSHPYLLAAGIAVITSINLEYIAEQQDFDQCSISEVLQKRDNHQKQHHVKRGFGLTVHDEINLARCVGVEVVGRKFTEAIAVEMENLVKLHANGLTKVSHTQGQIFLVFVSPSRFFIAMTAPRGTAIDTRFSGLLAVADATSHRKASVRRTSVARRAASHDSIFRAWTTWPPARASSSAC